MNLITIEGAYRVGFSLDYLAVLERPEYTPENAAIRNNLDKLGLITRGVEDEYFRTSAGRSLLAAASFSSDSPPR